MNQNALASERWVVAGQISPGAKTVTEHLSAAIDMGLYHSIMAINMTGVMGASGTSLLALKAADAVGGSYDATVKTSTALVKATDDDKQSVVNLKAEDLAQGDRFVKASLTIGGNTSDAGVVVLGEKRYGPEVGNSLGSERLAVLSVIDSDVYADGAAVGPEWVDASKFGQIMAVLVGGTVSGAASAAVTFEQATSSAGAGAKAITGKTLTAVTDTSPALSIRGEDLDAAGGFRYVRATLTVTEGSPAGTAAAAVVLLGADPRTAPADDHDLASVAQIVQ